MQQKDLRELIKSIQRGETDTEQALQLLKALPFEKVEDFAHLDHHRSIRCGFPEVVFGAGKTNQQVIHIVERLLAQGSSILVTRVTIEMAEAVLAVHPQLTYHQLARVLTWNAESLNPQGNLLVVSGGTADIPVADEAAITAQMMGANVERIYDVGVAGIHRVLSYVDQLQQARVIVVAAGMEGALASVVAGLVDIPVIAVPTSVGYGASFQGLAALLAMLNSCANGVSVVNIDNGFGAGYQAALINRRAS